MKKLKSNSPEYQKNYRKKNKKKIAAYSKEYREKNKVELLRKIKIWKENNPDKVRGYMDKHYSKLSGNTYNRDYYLANKEKYKAAMGRYLAKGDNKEKILKTSREWYVNNREKAKSYQSIRNIVMADDIREKRNTVKARKDNHNYYLTNIIKIKEDQKLWKLSHQKEIKEYSLKRKADGSTKAYLDRTKKTRTAYQRQYYRNNKEKCKKYNKEYREKNRLLKK